MATYRGYIGTYTKADSEGIYTFELDTGKKELSTPKPAAKLGSPTYLNIINHRIEHFIIFGEIEICRAAQLCRRLWRTQLFFAGIKLKCIDRSIHLSLIPAKKS